MPTHCKEAHCQHHSQVAQTQTGNDSFFKPAANVVQRAPTEREVLQTSFNIKIEKRDKDWSTEEIAHLKTVLSKLKKKEAEVLSDYRFIRWSTKEARKKVDKTYVDPGTSECGLHEMDLKAKSYKISLYDGCFKDPEATSHTAAGVDIGQFHISHEIGHAMANAELRRTWEAYIQANEDYNKANDAFNAAIDDPAKQKKMQPGVDKLAKAEEAAKKKMEKSNGRAEGDMAKLMKGKDRPTEYSKTNDTELFAEMYAYYKSDPAWVKSEHPKVFEWFEKNKFL